MSANVWEFLLTRSSLFDGDDNGQNRNQTSSENMYRLIKKLGPLQWSAGDLYNNFSRGPVLSPM